MQSLISREILDELSYTSRLGRSLKQISLRQTPLELILEDIGRYRANYIDTLIQENLIGSRFKSDDSIMRKYKKTLRTNGGFKQCFNDVLGFRLKMWSIRLIIQSIFGLWILDKEKKWMMVIGQFICTINVII